MASFFRTNIDNFVSSLRVFENYCRGLHNQQSTTATNPRQQTRHRPPYFRSRPAATTTTTTNSSHQTGPIHSSDNNRGSSNTHHETCQFSSSRCQYPHQSHPQHQCGRARQNFTGTHNQSGNQEQQQQQSNMNTNPSSARANPSSTQIKTNDKLDIGDILDPSDISRLGAKELKTILTRNCIDYKGCFEKEELREKVMRLWIDFNEKKATRRHNRRRQQHNQDSSANRSQDSSDEIDDNQLCKICMEREIDCVLLECGHYLTCVTCGRKLAECPICRQNITRCVRTFKG